MIRRLTSTVPMFRSPLMGPTPDMCTPMVRLAYSTRRPSGGSAADKVFLLALDPAMSCHRRWAGLAGKSARYHRLYRSTLASQQSRPPLLLL